MGLKWQALVPTLTAGEWWADVPEVSAEWLVGSLRTPTANSTTFLHGHHQLVGLVPSPPFSSVGCCLAGDVRGGLGWDSKFNKKNGDSQFFPNIFLMNGAVLEVIPNLRSQISDLFVVPTHNLILNSQFVDIKFLSRKSSMFCVLEKPS